ncbi:MAG: tRNA threonylcarbamoyladenosine biosynthesis protein TsaB, partial [Actinomycetota bacterium]|nr:tRNA threonylcarbamoyladenosine biosynthesis protein TsaB [Actinomycetota bacterium]
DPEAAGPDVADPDVADPDVADPDVADPDVADPDVADPDVADPEAAGPEGTPARSPLGEGCEFLVASDARRREVYWARYTVRDGLPRRQGPPRVDSPAALPRGLPVVGRGAVLYGESLGPAREPHEVHAADLARVAVRGLAGEDGLLLPPEPLYLRRPDATVPGTPKRVNGQWSVH